MVGIVSLKSMGTFLDSVITRVGLQDRSTLQSFIENSLVCIFKASMAKKKMALGGFVGSLSTKVIGSNNVNGALEYIQS